MTISEVLQDLSKLPPAPQILPQVLNLLSDANSNSGDIVQLVSMDLSLTAQILRLSNSVYFGRTIKTYDLTEAIQQIGMKEVYKLIALICSKDLLSNACELFELEEGQLWRYSIGSALAMEIMAQQKDKPTASAYTIGLLHCLGKMVINFRCSNEYKGVFDKIEAENTTLVAAEKAVLGFTHPQIAEALLRKWEFKEEIATPIGFQDRPMDAPVYKDLACMLHLAMWIAAHIGLNFGKHSWAMQTHPETAEYLKFDEEKLQEIMIQTDDRLDTVQAMMGIKVNTHAHP